MSGPGGPSSSVRSTSVTVTYSEEQAQYIYFTEKCDTKLLATAGSGKTFCIIHRMQNLINHGIYSPHRIFMLTFSKNAKEDFITKLKKNRVDEIPIGNINTIDSFAYAILGENIARSIDVSILSYSLLRLLKEIHAFLENPQSETPIMKTFLILLDDVMAKLERVKCIFIDEAQDLNEIQYEILLFLKKVCNAELNFIGDPNQNIYQFRLSSDKYLVQYEARTFHLTKNYRSQSHIVEFCSNLRPYNTVELNFENDRAHPNLDVTFYTYKSTQCFENYLLSILHFFKAKNIPFHKVAILSPTRGYLRTVKGVGKYKGLCYIANLLFKHDIPFQQFYNDMGSSGGNKGSSEQNDASGTSWTHGEDDGQLVSQFDGSKITYRMRKNHINLMTYTASKGLEWDYVIIVDANAHLISRYEYDMEKYKAEKYLLYVACSRPRKNLIIFTKHRYTNPWFKDVPQEKYRLARICDADLEFFDTSKLFTPMDALICPSNIGPSNIGPSNIGLSNIGGSNIGGSSIGSNTRLVSPSDATDVKKDDKDGEKNGEKVLQSTYQKHVLSHLLRNLDESELFEINKLLLPYFKKETYKVEELFTLCCGAIRETGISYTNKTKLKVPDNRQGFASKFLEHFFYVYIFQNALQNTHLLRDINNIIKSRNILYCSSEFIIKWYFNNRDTMTWESYDALKPDIHRRIVEFVDARFDRDQPFASYTLVDKFYDAFISSNFSMIQDFFKNYMENPYDLENVLYMALVSYAVESTHYFYVMQYKTFYAEIVEKNKDYLENLAHIFKRTFGTHPHTSTRTRVSDFRTKVDVSPNIVSYLDFKSEDMPWKVKSMGEDKLRDIITMLITLAAEKNVLHSNIKNNQNNDMSFYNDILHVKYGTMQLSIGQFVLWEYDVPCGIVHEIYKMIQKFAPFIEVVNVSHVRHEA